MSKTVEETLDNLGIEFDEESLSNPESIEKMLSGIDEEISPADEAAGYVEDVPEPKDKIPTMSLEEIRDIIQAIIKDPKTGAQHKLRAAELLIKMGAHSKKNDAKTLLNQLLH